MHEINYFSFSQELSFCPGWNWNQNYTVYDIMPIITLTGLYELFSDSIFKVYNLNIYVIVVLFWIDEYILLSSSLHN